MYFLLFLQGVVFANYLPEDLSQQSISCSSYSCAPPKTTKPSPLACISSSSSSSYMLWPCASGTSCNTTSGLCAPTAVSTAQSYVGEPCASSTDCYLSSCSNSTCQGLHQNQACTSHAQCNIGLRCFYGNSTCQPQLALGKTGCKSYLDCVNWATCNSSVILAQSTCLAYASVPLGGTVSDCSGGFSYLCASGACSKTSIFSSVGVCMFPPVSNYVLPHSCKQDTDCAGTSAGQSISSSCGCGYNANATSYCMPFIGDVPGKNMITTWAAALKLTAGCNTARRSATGCMKMVGMLKNTTQATLGYYNYPSFIGNDQCVQAVITNNYWMEGGMLLNAFLAALLVYF